MNLITTIAAFLVTLGVLIVIHELGHYWVARWCGVKVLRFSIGFGRPIARWVRGPAKKLEEFREKAATNLAIDAAGELVYLAPTRVNLQLTQERWPDLAFAATREHAHALAVE